MPTDTEFAKVFIIFMAVLALYVADFAINAGAHIQLLHSRAELTCSMRFR